MFNITDEAQEQIRATLAESGEDVLGLRIIAFGRAQYRLDLVAKGEEQPHDIIQDYEGFKAFMDPHSAEALDQATLEFVRTEDGGGFRIENPQDEPKRPEGGRDAEIWDAVQKLLDNTVNPSVAQHGGVISLVDVKDRTVYVHMGGGCQGCGMANVTLRNGVEMLLREEIPDLVALEDITNHAEGQNPYYAASTK